MTAVTIMVVTIPRLTVKTAQGANIQPPKFCGTITVPKILIVTMMLLFNGNGGARFDISTACC
jgi:hypothetical protein